MTKIHIALAVDDLDATIEDYSRRLHADPVTVAPDRYALWRTPVLNLSVTVTPGAGQRLRHLGFEDDALEPGEDTDVNGIVWERFSAAAQAAEIAAVYGPTT